ncbi:MAG: hypothetical protein ACI8RD_013113, partial [Bacillariaceae sp.]
MGTTCLGVTVFVLQSLTKKISRQCMKAAAVAVAVAVA